MTCKAESRSGQDSVTPEFFLCKELGLWICCTAWGMCLDTGTNTHMEGLHEHKCTDVHRLGRQTRARLIVLYGHADSSYVNCIATK